MPSKVSGVLRGYWGSIGEALDGSERCLRGLIGVLKELWASSCLRGALKAPGILRGSSEVPQRCLRGVLEESQRCLGGLIGASVVPWRSDMHLVGALEVPWRCSGGALEVHQECLG